MAASLVRRGITNVPAAHEHLLSRATFGARPSDRRSVAALGIDGWIEAQLNPSRIADPGGDAVRKAFPLGAKSIPGVRSSIDEFSWDAMFAAGQLALGRQVHSSRQVFEIVADVMANLLNVTVPSDTVWDSGPDYVRTVVRAHAFGRFEDMLMASMRHPAMLTYLGNADSDRTSVNENLGRELLELHTVGILAGYTETDVRNSAYILSGRTVTWETGRFRWDPDRHWVGPVKVLGYSNTNADPSTGLAVGDRYLRYLARHASTARTVARKLAVRFVSDTPPTALVDRMAQAYLANGTQIVPMLRTMFSSTEFWTAPQAKTRRPLEDVVGTARAIDTRAGRDLAEGITNLYWNLWDAGHAPLAWIPPNGYPDVAGAWQSASQMVGRWNTHQGLAHGWWTGVTPPVALEKELAPTPNMTYGTWIDLISHRVVGRAVDAPRKAALLGFLAARSGELVPSWRAWEAPAVAALVLDGPHHQLR